MKINDVSNLLDSLDLSEQIELRNASEYIKLEPGYRKSAKSSRINRILMDSHLEILKKYLKEDILIGYTEARNRLSKETDFNVALIIVKHALIKLKQEISQDEAELSLSRSEKKNNSKSLISDYLKLKDLHIEYLKYQKEEGSIDPTKAAEILQKDTGLMVYATISDEDLPPTEKKTDPESFKSLQPISGIEYKSKKLKDAHIECLKNYLIENSTIGPTEAAKKLQDETDLEVHPTTISRALIAIKKKMDPESFKPQYTSGIEYKSKKLKDAHIECLKNCLIENSSIGPTEAAKILQKETGLEVSVSSVSRIMKKIREKVESE